MIINLKGTICLFLFLLLYEYASAQPFSLKIISENQFAEHFIKDLNYKKKYKDTLQLKNELYKSIDILRSYGFISASYDSILYDSSQVKAYLFLGKQYVCSDLNIAGDINPKKYISDLSKIKKDGIDIYKLQSLYEQILRDLENNGYPFARVNPENIKLTDSVLSLDIIVLKNQLYRFNKLIIKGNSNISEHFIKRYISFYKGSRYDESLLEGINEKLSNLSFLKIIRAPEAEFYDNKTDLYLYLDKKKANLFNGIIGFAGAEEQSGINLTGELSLQLHNNFNKGEYISLWWKGVGKGSQKLKTSLYYPYLLKSPFSLDLKFSFDKKDTTFLNLRYDLGINYSFKNNDKIKAYYSSYKSLIISQSLNDSTLFSDAETSMFGISYHTEHFDYKFNPRKGLLFYVDVAEGKRISNDDKNNYFECSAAVDVYIPLYKNLILKLKTDNKFALSDEVQYENELFRIGGYNTLRGFAEDNFSVSEYSIFTFELRYLYEMNSNAFLFADAARLRFRTNEQNSIKYPYSFGIGTNLSTKAGIFSISYALGTVDNNPIQFSASNIHIGYVNRF